MRFTTTDVERVVYASAAARDHVVWYAKVVLFVSMVSEVRYAMDVEGYRRHHD